jgi:hypothetical protein
MKLFALLNDDRADYWCHNYSTQNCSDALTGYQ